MIAKQDILDRAGEWQLRPEVVEKDYVLGWLLWGLGRQSEVREMWVFKGGTCLKKCYLETYRFSEDLDFTLRPGAPYTRDAILSILREVAGAVAVESGIEVSSDTVIVDEKRDKQRRPTFKARLGYKGPLAFPGAPRRILFDLTVHEPLLRDPVEVSIFHPYPDVLPEPSTVYAYSIEELLAEKTRALRERTRPRDLYDVVYVINNQNVGLDLSRAGLLFREKCLTKGLEVPTSSELVAHIRAAEELRSEWKNMLRHQLPQLPPIDTMLDGILMALYWIDDAATRSTPALERVPMPSSHESVAPPGIQFWGPGVGLEAIRFAGANRLLVRLTYRGEDRFVEPYALQRANTGEILLYAWDVASSQLMAYNAAEIQHLRPTDKPFMPRYQVEFLSGGFAPIRPSGVPE